MRDHEKGFTLIEVMVSMAILAIALVALIGLRNRSIKNVKEAEDLSRASLIAEKLMGEIQLLGLQTTKKEGVEEGYRWTVNLAPTFVEDVKELRLTLWKDGEKILELVEYKY